MYSLLVHGCYIVNRQNCSRCAASMCHPAILTTLLTAMYAASPLGHQRYEGHSLPEAPLHGCLHLV